jgi:hypothetical protein
MKIESFSHHVGNAIGQQVIFAKRIAPVALDIDDTLGVAVGPGKVFADAGKIYVVSLALRM